MDVGCGWRMEQEQEMTMGKDTKDGE